MGAFDREKCRRIVGINDDHKPIAMVPVGEPANILPPRARNPIEYAVTFVGEPENGCYREAETAYRRYEVKNVSQPGAVFENVNLSGSNITNANLSDTSFSNANMRKCSFGGMTLAESKFGCVEMNGSSFENVDFNGAKFKNCSFNDAEFEGCNVKTDK